MDMKTISRIPPCGIPLDLTGKKVVVGSKQLKKALRDGRAEYVFLAENADPAVTDPIAALCISGNIHIHWVASMADLGRACGIEVGAAAAAVVVNP